MVLTGKCVSLSYLVAWKIELNEDLNTEGFKLEVFNSVVVNLGVT